MADQTSQDTGRLYSQLEQDGYILREFSKETTSLELVWHRDKVDRYVEPVKESDWLFQLDNDIPRKLGKNKLFIPKETYHRLIKGTGDLIVKIWEVNET